MEEKNLPFQYEDKQAVNELLEQMNLFLKDCDAAEEKAMVKDFLKKASSLFEFVVIGGVWRWIRYPVRNLNMAACGKHHDLLRKD